MQPVDADLAPSLGLGRPAGVLVNQIYPDGPAARAGIAKGDVILAVDGRGIEDDKALNFRLAIGALGKHANVDVWRRGREVSLRLPLESPPYRPEPEPTSSPARRCWPARRLPTCHPA